VLPSTPANTSTNISFHLQKRPYSSVCNGDTNSDGSIVVDDNDVQGPKHAKRQKVDIHLFEYPNNQHLHHHQQVKRVLIQRTAPYYSKSHFPVYFESYPKEYQHWYNPHQNYHRHQHNPNTIIPSAKSNDKYILPSISTLQLPVISPAQPSTAPFSSFPIPHPSLALSSLLQPDQNM
jgi:hypothetical protein